VVNRYNPAIPLTPLVELLIHVCAALVMELIETELQRLGEEVKFAC
jgi:hypothetical protein